MKKHLGFILFFTAVIFVFLGKLIFMKSSFLWGDYLSQFYPWSKVYSEAIKNFSFPFWTGYINSGFPLMAEGQIGGFYPLNILVYFLLPFDVAYSYSIILHFTLGGIFTYIYTRKIGADQWGASLAALIFCFGSTFAGCPYLRTLVWFPLGLFVIEKYFDNKQLHYSIYFGVILALQLLAGFVQMAIYSALFSAMYFFYGLWLRNILKINDIKRIFLAFCTAAILFLPQFVLSAKMAGLSARTQTSLGFALWGSFNPLSLVSLCFPEGVIYGTQFYIGIFTLVFLIYAMRMWKREIKIKAIFMILLVSFFLALGAYNPLYVLFLKMTHFYGFRNPSKFLFFSVFAAAILSGWGFTQFFKTKETAKYFRAAILLISINIVIFISASVAVRLFKEKILEFGKWYAAGHIFGKDFHRHNLQTYFSKVEALHGQFINATSLSNGFVLISLAFCAAAIFLSVYMIKHKNATRLCRIFFMAVILLDLFIFSFYGMGFSANIKSFSSLKTTHNKILYVIKSDKDIFRVMPFALANQNMPWWMNPSANILVGIETIASYSPLVQQSYKEALSSLEIVDNSLGLIFPEKKSIKDKYDLLRMLNVKYIVASEELDFDFLEKVIYEDKIWLYKIKDYLPRVFFTNDISGSHITDVKIKYLDALDYKNGFLKVKLSSNTGGFLVFSENNYPGWIAYVDGELAPIVKLDIIQAVKLCSGEHDIIFKYSPYNLSEK